MTTTDHSRTTIAEQAAALKEGIASQVPAGVVAAFAAEQADLESAGLPSGIPQPGSVMPDGALLDVHGAPTTLLRAREGRPAVVVFYRGAWCPYCNLTLRTYQEQVVPALDERNVALIAISPQTPDGSLSMRETNELTYTVLSDPGNQIAGQLSLLTAPTEAARGAQAELGLDLTAVNADGTHTLPMPSTVLVGADGTIRWIDVHPDYTTRTEAGTILDAVEKLLG